MTLDHEDIEAIAAAVVRKMGMAPGRDLAKIADMPLKERQKYWKSVRNNQKKKAA